MVGVEIVFIILDNALILYSFYLTKWCSYNTAEYEAIIIGLKLALQISVAILTIYDDSELVPKQLR